MIEVAEAKRLLRSGRPELDTIEVGLDEAIDRVLAEEIRADRDLPAADLSTMDGFAIRASDTASPPSVLRVRGEVRAGQEPEGSVGSTEAIRIFTGALVPPGADAVVMVERTQEGRERGTVEILDPVPSGQHIRRQGEDVRAGRTVLAAGTVVHAAEVAAMASVGRTRVRIHRAPVVHVLSTGDELVDPEAAPSAHQVRDSNRVTLLAQLREIGLTGVSLGVARDDGADLEEKLGRGLSADVLLITGGVSMGAYDLVGRALERSGMRLLFHQVAVRPGKPLLAGRRGGCLVVGLPGNPISTFTTFAVFVAPVLRSMMGYARSEPPEVEATLTERLVHKPGRTTYHLARLVLREGKAVVAPARTMGSGDVVSLVRANAFVVTTGDAATLEAGASVAALPWREFHVR